MVIGQGAAAYSHCIAPAPSFLGERYSVPADAFAARRVSGDPRRAAFPQLRPGPPQMTVISD
jgi:hypothetical protein